MFGWLDGPWNPAFFNARRGRISSANLLNQYGFFLLENPRLLQRMIGGRLSLKTVVLRHPG